MILGRARPNGPSSPLYICCFFSVPLLLSPMCEEVLIRINSGEREREMGGKSQ